MLKTEFSFQIANDNNYNLKKIITRRGNIDTPAFMPVSKGCKRYFHR